MTSFFFMHLLRTLTTLEPKRNMSLIMHRGEVMEEISTQNFGYLLSPGENWRLLPLLSSSHSLYHLAFLSSINEAIILICHWLLLKKYMAFLPLVPKLDSMWLFKLNPRRCSVHFLLLCHHYHKQIHLALIQLSLPLKWGGNFHTVRMFYCDVTFKLHANSATFIAVQ